LLTRTAYGELLRLARRQARGRVEAEDLLHDALAAALAARRPVSAESRAWLAGTMRNMAAMAARTAVRRRRREEATAQSASPSSDQPGIDAGFTDDLPPGLRIVALLALSGHNRAEIRYLLRISDDALRQRISGIRRVLARRQDTRSAEFTALKGSLAFGSIRRSLLPLMRAGIADFASHDPDGHPIAFRFSTSRPHKTGARGN
jgi:RNA polymerase sigma-70 factor (ECF subfamily)